MARSFTGELPSLSPRALRWIVVSLAALALVVVSFPGPALGLRTFFMRDFGYAHYPESLFWARHVRHGELPLWNPLDRHGLPFLAQWNTTSLYPLALLYALAPEPWGVNAFMLLHLWLAVVGAWALARRVTGSEVAAAYAGVAFAWSGVCQSALEWTNGIAALAWMPWLVLAVCAAARGGARPIAVASVVAALQLLSGAPEVIVASWLVALVLVASEARVPWGRAPRVVLRVGAVVGVAALLAAPQLGPFFDLLHRSTRSGGTPLTWALPSSGWANLLVPPFHCMQSRDGVVYQPEQQWIRSYYLGIGTLALAVAAPFIRRDRRSLALALLLVVSAVLSLGDAGLLYPWLRRAFPALGVMRYPAKFMLPPALLVPLLAATTLGALADPDREVAKRARRFAVGIGAAALVLVGLLLALPPASHPRVVGATDVDASLVLSSVLSRGALLVVTVAAAVALGLAPLRRVWVAAALAATAWLDGTTHLPLLTPTAPLEVLEPGLLRAELPGSGGVGRVHVDAAEERWLSEVGLPDLTTEFVYHRLYAVSDSALLDDVGTTEGFFPLSLPHERAFAEVVASLPHGAPAREALLDFEGATHELSLEGRPHWVARSTALPLVTAGLEPRFGDDEHVQSYLAGDFDPRRIVYLPEEAREATRAQFAVPARVSALSIRADAVSFDVEAADGTWAVVAQSDYPAWRARVDGAPTPIHRANLAFQGLEIPAGRHHVELVYEDRAFRWGLAGTGLGVLFVGALAWLDRRKATAPPPTARGGAAARLLP